MKKSFTEENIKAFWNSIAAKLAAIDESAEDAADIYVDIIFEAQQQLDNEYNLPKGYSAEQIIDSLENGYLNSLPFAAPISTTMKSTKVLSVEDMSDAAKVWKKTPEVLDNLKTLCADIESLSEQEANKLIDSLTKTASDIALNKGVICSPKKYVANCPIKPPKGATVIEIRVQSSNKAQYRVYGLLINKKIYLLKAQTKNSGQENADAFFDNFLKYANTIKFNESVSYNNIRGAEMKDDVFNELNEIYDIQCLESWAKGNNDAWEGKLCEDTADKDYKLGYDSAMVRKKKADVDDLYKENDRKVRAFYLAHKEEIDSKLKKKRK